MAKRYIHTGERRENQAPVMRCLYACWEPPAGVNVSVVTVEISLN